MAAEAASHGIRGIRFSFAQWYRKSIRRAGLKGFDFIDPSEEEKRAAAGKLADRAAASGLRLHACSQDLLSGVAGVRPSSCIDGTLIQDLHPRKETVSCAKDPAQRLECRCTRSVDIGSYTQACSHSCLYCYANPGGD